MKKLGNICQNNIIPTTHDSGQESHKDLLVRKTRIKKNVIEKINITKLISITSTRRETNRLILHSRRTWV